MPIIAAKDSVLKKVGEKHGIPVLDKYEMRALDFADLQIYIDQRKKLLTLAASELEKLKKYIHPFPSVILLIILIILKIKLVSTMWV